MENTHVRCALIRILRALVLAWLIGAIAAAASGQPIVYVDDDAAPGGNGSSWGTAYNSLQAALDAAAARGSGVTEIRVGQGLYVPTARTNPADPRSATFQLLNGVALLGGYAGVGAKDPDARDPEQFESVLSGDVNGDDLPDFLNNAENVFHVVVGSGTTPATLLEGLVVEGGNANLNQGPQTYTSRGGGMLNDSGNATIHACTFRRNSALSGAGMFNQFGSSPVINECTFLQNKATSGGVLYNYQLSSPVITQCKFVSNNTGSSTIGFGAVDEDGQGECRVDLCTFEDNSTEVAAGIHTGYVTSAVITRCVFSNNSASVGGGAIVTLSPAEITDCVFQGNHAAYAGGALSLGAPATVTNCEFVGNHCDWIGGGAACASTATFINCTFSRNIADDGGAIAIVDADVSLTNCSVSSNQVGGVALIDSSSVVIKNSVVWGNQGYQVAQLIVDPPPPPLPGDPITIFDTDIQGGWSGPGSGNINADPMFLQPGCDNLRLAYGSPCIDLGNNASIPPGVTTDLDGQARIQNGIVDMGAYEGGHDPLPPTACEDNLDQGWTVKLMPTGGPFNPPTTSAIYIENVSAPDDAWVTVTQVDSAQHPGAGGFNDLGSNLDVQTSIPDSQFFMRVYIPFTPSNLNGFDPLDADLTYFDSQSGNWQLAALANTQNSPGHKGPVGDRIVTVGSSWNNIWTFELGDYGVFWNPSTQQGFVWANVDHASDFAFGIKLPQCSGDCAYPTNGTVNQDDLTTVINAWGLTPVGPASFADINHDGMVNAADLLAVLNGWGPCP